LFVVPDNSWLSLALIAFFFPFLQRQLPFVAIVAASVVTVASLISCEDGWKISKTWLPNIHQKKRKKVTREDIITTEAASIATIGNCRCRKRKRKHEEC